MYFDFKKSAHSILAHQQINDYVLAFLNAFINSFEEEPFIKNWSLFLECCLGNCGFDIALGIVLLSKTGTELGIAATVFTSVALQGILLIYNVNNPQNFMSLISTSAH